MTKFSPPRGTKDLLPIDFYAWRKTLETLRGTVASYGFKEVSTPAFENIEVFEAKSGEAIREQIYTFKDKSGRVLGLRSDLTPAISRLVASSASDWPKPIKISCVDKVWRYEAPQTGRYREIQHVNAEMFGAPGTIADAEIIACFADCYRSIGLSNIRIQVGHRRFLNEMMLNLGVVGESMAGVVRALDKRGKITDSALAAEVAAAGMPLERIDELDEFLKLEGDAGTTIELARARYSGNPRLESALCELEGIFEHLNSYGVLECCTFAPGLARGFDYYTGVLFECSYPNPYGIGAIGGGGRYDELIEVYGGPPMPAVGFALGIDRIMILLEKESFIDKNSLLPRPEYYVATVTPNLKAFAIDLVEKLRRMGLIVEFDLDFGRSLSKQMGQAHRRNARCVLIIGEEIQQGLIVRRLLDTGDESTISIESLVEQVTK